MNNIKDIILKQKNYYLSGKTKDINFRIDNLKKLKRLIKENEEIILDALKKDLGKSNFEGYITEIGMVYEEINIMIKSIKKWSKRERVKSSINYYPVSAMYIKSLME